MAVTRKGTTASLHGPQPSDPSAAVGSPPRRAHADLTARDWARSLLFVGTVLVFAVGPLLLLVLLLGLFFNAYTIHLTLFVLGLLAFLHGFTEYRNRLSVTGTATATASSAAIGLVELSGRGYVDNPSDAPVTRKPCAYWRVEVRHRGEKDFRWLDGLWNRVTERSSGRPENIVLVDNTSRMLVWTHGAEVIPIKERWRSDRGGDPPEGVLRFIAALGLQWPSRGNRFPMKVTEERIEQGGPLYVMGTLAERRQILAPSKGFFGTLLDRWALPPADGAPANMRSSRAVVDHARNVGLRWLVKQWPFPSESSPPALDQHQVLVWKGDQRRPFIVSGVLERGALRALSSRTWAYLLGGAGLMALMLWEFLEKLAGNMHW